MTPDTFSLLYEREIAKLIQELQAYRNEENCWMIDHEIKNSAGNLAQHLIGNLNTYIGKALGGFAYTRDRDAEFGKRLFTREELIAHLKDTSTRVRQSIDNLPADSLDAPYPKEVLVMAGGDTIGYILLHLLSHLSYHLGQVNYHRRLVDR